MLTSKMRDLDRLAKESTRISEERASYPYAADGSVFPFTSDDYQNEQADEHR